jgi:hypothetical protein
MAQASYPFDNTDTTEAQYSQLFRRLNRDGVWGSPTGTELKVTGDSSGMQVKVAAGFGMVRGHFYSNDSVLTLSIAAANATNPRIDLVVLKLDPTANSITAVVKTGTAASSPSAPTLTVTDTGVMEVTIAQVAVAANATTISAGNVTDLRPFMGTAFAVWTTATRPTSPTVPTVGLNTTLNAPEFWDGTAWTSFLPAVTAALISASEQANITAGKIRAGGISAGAATSVFIQSGTPTANATGDLWFW